MPDTLRLEWIPGRYAICRLDPATPLPPWAASSAASARHLLSITRTGSELSVVIDETAAPKSIQAQRGFAAIRVAGQLDFALVGILSRLTGALAQAGVPVFAISTHDTDVLLIPESRIQEALASLARAADVSALSTTGTAPTPPAASPDRGR